jgi:hypothetical protein
LRSQSYCCFLLFPGAKDKKSAALFLALRYINAKNLTKNAPFNNKIAFPAIPYICLYMDKEKLPGTESCEKEKEIKEEPIIHDGSGGAFEGTEMVSEEREDCPKPPSPTPY